jgi:hypothetical protein
VLFLLLLWVVAVRSAIFAWALSAIILNTEIKINQAKQSQEEVRNLIEFKDERK